MNAEMEAIKIKWREDVISEGKYDHESSGLTVRQVGDLYREIYRLEHGGDFEITVSDHLRLCKEAVEAEREACLQIVYAHADIWSPDTGAEIEARGGNQ